MLERPIETSGTLRPDSMLQDDPSSDAEGVFSFRQANLLLIRRKWLIAFCAAVCVVIAAVLSAVTPPTYTATSQLLFNETEVRVLDQQEVFLEETLSNPFIESQMLVIRSPLVLAEVVDALDLTNNPTFMEEAKTPLSAFMEELVMPIADTFGYTPPEDIPVSESDRRETAIKRLRTYLGVTRSGLTRVVQVRYTSSSPELSALIANNVVETFLAVRVDSRVQSATRAAEWFDRRLAELNERALEAERRLEQFGTNESTSGPSPQNVQTRLTDLRLDLQNSMSDRAQAQVELKALSAALVGGNGLAGLSDQYRTPEMQASADTLRALNNELAILRSDGGSAERVETIQREIDRMEDLTWGMIEDAARQANEKLSEAVRAENLAQQAFLEAQSEDSSRVSGTQQALIRQYENEAKVYRELQQSYFGSYVRTIQQQTFPSSGGTIIQTAQPPEFPQGFGLKKIAVMAALVGIVLGIIIAIILDTLEGTVRSRQHLQTVTQRALFGLLPPLNTKRTLQPLPVSLASPSGDGTTLKATSKSFSNLIPEGVQVIREPMATYSASIRRARLELDKATERRTNSKKPCVTGFISETGSEGRSTAALNYAEMLALRGKRTLLVDLDWFEPKLSQKIAGDAKQGVIEIANNPSQILEDTVLTIDQFSGLYFLANRDLTTQRVLSGVDLDTSRTATFLSGISSHFDEVVIDLPAMSASIDWLALSEICDGFILVSDWGVTRRAALKERMQGAGAASSKVVGNLLSGVTEKEFAAYS